MSDEWFGPAYGRQLSSGPHGEGEIALLEIEHQARPERVARARQFFQQARFADFEALGTKGRRWLHRESGREFVVDDSQVLDALDPTAVGVEFFVVHAGRMWFLRARDHDPTRRTFLGRFYAGQLVRGTDGRDALRPAKMMGKYDDRQWVPER